MLGVTEILDEPVVVINPGSEAINDSLFGFWVLLVGLDARRGQIKHVQMQLGFSALESHNQVFTNFVLNFFWQNLATLALFDFQVGTDCVRLVCPDF